MLFLCDLASTTLSPRMRGCFYASRQLQSLLWAFPAYAGMFPAEGIVFTEPSSFPRVCGDVS